MISLMKRCACLINVGLTVQKMLYKAAPTPLGVHACTTLRQIHAGVPTLTRYERKSKTQSSIILHSFDNTHEKNRETYLEVLRKYVKYNSTRRGHVEFIRVALKYMEEFGVERDLEVYRELLDILPKGKFIPTHRFQMMLHHYPKQQRVALEVLSQMEEYTVIPDYEMEAQLLNIFGRHGLPLKKYWRMRYWMLKFNNLNPWPVSKPAPTDARVLARLALAKMSSPDKQSKLSEFETEDVIDAVDDTWIVSAMSVTQKELLQRHSPADPLFIEGPNLVWVGDKSLNYFVLRGDPKPKEDVYEDTDDVSNIRIPFWDKKEIALKTTLHEQEDGVFFAMCATGTSSKDSLLSWIRCLQQENPCLKKIPIVFKIASSTKDSERIEEGEKNTIEMVVKESMMDARKN